MNDAEKAGLRRHLQAWQISRFLHGEQGALDLLGEDRPAGAGDRREILCGDSGRGRGEGHCEAYAAAAARSSTCFTRSIRTWKSLLDDTLRDSRWDFTYLGMQVLIEGLALAAFGVIRDYARNRWRAR